MLPSSISLPRNVVKSEETYVFVELYYKILSLRNTSPRINCVIFLR